MLLGLQGSALADPPQGFLGSFRWYQSQDSFGGFSAIELDPGGRNLLALTDQGVLFAGTISRDGSGRITSVQAQPLAPLDGPDGPDPSDKRIDTEGLAANPGGRGGFVSTEGPARVLAFDRFDRPPRALPRPKAWAKLPRNAGLEALAIGPDGSLFTLSERPGKKGFAVYRHRDGNWQDWGMIPAEGGFMAVAMDVGPDGRLYLLERNLRGLAGFSSRLRRFDITRSGPANETLLWQTAFGTHQNLEGLAIWRDASGSLRASMISDDNFTFPLSTEIVEYRLAD